MYSLLGLVVRFSRTTSRIPQPAVFFSSNATLSNRDLERSQELVKELLKKNGLPLIRTWAPLCTEENIEALRIKFQPACCSNQIIPEVEVDAKDFPEEYVLPEIHSKELEKQNFKISEIYNNNVRTFALKLNWAVRNSGKTLGTFESNTDTLLYDLLRIVGLNTFPFVIRKHQPCKLFIGGHSYLIAEPEYWIKFANTGIIAAEDKHLRTIFPLQGYGEWQLAAEILTCASENVCRVYIGQVIYAIRIISTYVTFYKASISSEYWKDFDDNDLPREQSVTILRWPEENIPNAGINIAKPEGRREVLEGLVKIRKYLKKEDFVYD